MGDAGQPAGSSLGWPGPLVDRVYADHVTDAEHWYSRALPILRTIRLLEDDDVRDIGVAELAKRTDLTPGAVQRELRRLMDEDYILAEYDDGGYTRDPANAMLLEFQLSAAGARAVGTYPSRDPYEALVAILERRIAESPDEETRSRLRKLLDGVKRLTGEVGTNVVANVLVELGRAGI